MKTKKAFTLIEMLIVVVIIGILAAALIPRLQSVQGRARDTKRKADLSQIGSALAVYKSDFGSFIALSGSATGTNGLIAPLVTNGSYLTAMPVDSDTTSWPISSSVSVVSYGFATLLRNGISNAAFGLMAKTETDGTSSNWVLSTASAPSTATGGALIINGDASAYEAAVCTRVVASSNATQTTLSGGVCNALKSANDLRYVYFQ